ncbi:MAG TPA: lysophospholipid acyltransferase family protein [Actinomycetota bacterium]
MRRPEPWYRFAVLTLRPPIALWFNWRFEGMEHIPAEGPVLVAANHISYFDPLAHGLMLVKAGRRPRYLAKTELYNNWLLRHVLEGANQIRVERGSGSTEPLDNAGKALKNGESVVVYPEGTVTKNPDYTPMRAKTGIARLSLANDVPVVPIAVWGSQNVWQRDGARSLAFGRPIWVKAGPPLDFSRFDGQEGDPAVHREVTDTVMDELSRLVTDLRQRYPKRWQ